jgi:hypothetical protein
MTISFADFSKDLLAPWSGELPADGDAGDPRTAAMKAAFEASITHTKKRGTVLVVCDDATGARSCSDYLKSFFSDQPQLALLAKKISSDEIQLKHGTRSWSRRTRRDGRGICCVRSS